MLKQSTMQRTGDWINITPINETARDEVLDFLEQVGVGQIGEPDEPIQIHTSEIIGEADHIEYKILAKHGPVITHNK